MEKDGVTPNFKVVSVFLNLSLIFTYVAVEITSRYKKVVDNIMEMKPREMHLFVEN